MKFRIKGVDQIFESSGDAYDYVIEHEDEGISMEDIEEIPEEESTIEESPEENPDEDSEVIEEKDLIDFLALSKIVEDWDLLTDTEKREVLSVAFGKETKHDKHFEGKTKLFEGKVDGLLKSNIGNALGKYHLNGIIKKVELGLCPFCGEHHSQDQFYVGVDLPEELDFWKPDLRPIKENPPHFTRQTKAKSPPMLTKEAKIKLTIHHIKSRHIKLYKLLYDVFNQFQWVKDVPDMKLQPKSAPHSLSKENLEELSKEELALEICANPELRSQMLRKWKKKLEDRS